MRRKRVIVRGHMRTSKTGKRVHVDRHTRLIEGAKTPMAQRWFKPERTLQGWSKDQDADTRMYHLLQSASKRGRGRITRNSLVSTIRALVALANVTKDKETEHKARTDAKKLGKMLERYD